jgi:hypothetical protein
VSLILVDKNLKKKKKKKKATHLLLTIGTNEIIYITIAGNVLGLQRTVLTCYIK